MIKHDTFNNQLSNRLTPKWVNNHNDLNWALAIHMYALFVLSFKLFFGFFTSSKTSNRENMQNRL